MMTGRGGVSAPTAPLTTTRYKERIVAANKPITIGTVFRGMTVLAGPRLERTPDGRGNFFFYKCRCFCGGVFEAHGHTLLSGSRKSCGCLSAPTQFKTKHGASGSNKAPEYSSWAAMKDRCKRPGNASYRHYGGRGIKVCDRWLNDFEAFLADMGPRPDGHSIDRIDPNGNYEPSNCRWATAKEQCLTRRNDSDTLIELEGKLITVTKAAEKLGKSKATIFRWIRAGKFQRIKPSYPLEQGEVG